jgi:uncharacterized linocin/CFP29 family protein
MSSFGRDAIWDLDTWAEIDAAVADEVQRVSVVHQLFGVDKMGAAGQAAIAVPAGQVNPYGVLSVPESVVEAYAELAVPFDLTPAQAEAESTLHQGRALARLAAKRLALAVDQYVLRRPAYNVKLYAPESVGVSSRDGVYEEAATTIGAAPGNATQLLRAANQAISNLLTAAWPEPYALLLSNDLYTFAYSSIGGSTDTPVKRLAGRVEHVFTSPALTTTEGVLVSLAGEPITIYIARHAGVTFTGAISNARSSVHYRFRVSERLQYVIKDPTAIVTL